MFGCLRRLGCLIVLILLAGLGYYVYTHWDEMKTSEAPVEGTWAPVSVDVAARGEARAASLWQSGTRTVTLTPAEAVGYLIVDMAGFFPEDVRDIEASTAGDTLLARAPLELSQLDGAKVLGPLSLALSASDTVYLAVRADVIRPGLAQLRIERLTVGSLGVPRALIPKLIHHIRRRIPADSTLGVRPGELAVNAVPIPLPPHIGDLRIGQGKVTLFKSVQ